MKSYLIDPIAKTVTQVEHNGDYREIYKFIGADYFDVARLPNRDGIFVDDEGLLRNEPELPAFSVGHLYGGVLVGKGLVLGCNERGETVEPKISFEALRDAVIFATLRRKEA